jgi:hypothetical protein
VLGTEGPGAVPTQEAWLFSRPPKLSKTKRMGFWRRENQGQRSAAGGRSEADLIAEMNDPNSRMGRALEGMFEEMFNPESDLAQSIADLHRENEEECAHIVPQALENGYSPQELYDAVIAEFGRDGSPLAMMARGKLWEEQIRAADGDAFEARCAEVEALAQTMVHRDQLILVVDEEREARGLPPSPSKEAREQAIVDSFRNNRYLAAHKARIDAMSPEEFIEMISKDR